MPHRPIRYLLLFFITPFVLGPLLAPWIYLGIQKLALLPLFHELGTERFERVTTRTVQVIALLLAWPCIKHAGAAQRIGPTLRWSRARAISFLQWALVGIAMVLPVYAIGFASGNYSFDAERWGTSHWITIPLALIPAAMLVGLAEEYLVRGFVFGTLRTRYSFLLSAFISSALFSILHFLRPRLPAPLEEITWTSGFQLYPHMFALFRPALDWDFALTLFFMSMALCALLVRHNHLYGIAGLHAGWVWMLQTANGLVDQEPRYHSFWFGWGDNASQGALVTALSIVLVAVVWPRRKPNPAERAPS